MSELTEFIEEVMPILRYTVDKAAYVRAREEEHHIGCGLTEYDQWAKNRARIALNKWDEIRAKGGQMSTAERAEMEAVNELQIAQLLEQRDALLAALKLLIPGAIAMGWDLTAAKAAISKAEGRAE